MYIRKVSKRRRFSDAHAMTMVTEDEIRTTVFKVAMGTFSIVDPRGQFIGELGSAHDEELLVRDMDLDKIQEVRQTWQFFRDRRPDAYADLVSP